jgi:hypothetical protein
MSSSTGALQNEIAYRLSLFERKFSAGDPEDCWEWEAGTSRSGIGIFSGMKCIAPTDSVTAPAASWFFYRDRTYPFGSRSRVFHLCRNGLCVNPDHLAAGAPDDFPSYSEILRYLALRHPEVRAELEMAANVIE